MIFVGAAFLIVTQGSFAASPKLDVIRNREEAVFRGYHVHK